LTTGKSKQNGKIDCRLFSIGRGDVNIRAMFDYFIEHGWHRKEKE
jgi:hypothetical protein